MKDKASILLLKGGGVKGLALLGAADELEKYGFRFDTFVGTSAGSILSVLLGSGYTPSELLSIMAEKDFEDFLDPLYKIPWNLARLGLHSGDPIRLWLDDLLRRKLGARGIPLQSRPRLSDLPSRTVSFASKPGRGCLVFDKEGGLSGIDVVEAVRCSMSIPLFFTPARLGGVVFDGGLLANHPLKEFVDVERARGSHDILDKAIAVFLQHGEYRKERKSVLGSLAEIFLEKDYSETVKTHFRIHVVVNTYPIRTVQFKLSENGKNLLIWSGRLAARQFIEHECSENTYRPIVAEAQRQVERYRQEALRERSRRRRNVVLALFLASIMFGASRYLWSIRCDLDMVSRWTQASCDTTTTIQQIPQVVPPLRQLSVFGTVRDSLFPDTVISPNVWMGVDTLPKIDADVDLTNRFYHKALTVPMASNRVSVFAHAPRRRQRSPLVHSLNASLDSLEGKIWLFPDSWLAEEHFKKSKSFLDSSKVRESWKWINEALKISRLIKYEQHRAIIIGSASKTPSYAPFVLTALKQAAQAAVDTTFLESARASAKYSILIELARAGSKVVDANETREDTDELLELSKLFYSHARAADQTKSDPYLETLNVLARQQLHSEMAALAETYFENEFVIRGEAYVVRILHDWQFALQMKYQTPQALGTQEAQADLVRFTEVALNHKGALFGSETCSEDDGLCQLKKDLRSVMDSWYGPDWINARSST